MNNQAKIKLEKIKKLKLPEKVRATADKIEQLFRRIQTSRLLKPKKS